MTNEYIDPGIAYGYPECCRTAFDTLSHIGDHEHFEKFRTSGFLGTGFVPCAECLKKDPHDLVKEINSKRNPKLPLFELHGDVSLMDRVKVVNGGFVLTKI